MSGRLSPILEVHFSLVEPIQDVKHFKKILEAMIATLILKHKDEEAEWLLSKLEEYSDLLAKLVAAERSPHANRFAVIMDAVKECYRIQREVLPLIPPAEMLEASEKAKDKFLIWAGKGKTAPAGGGEAGEE